MEDCKINVDPDYIFELQNNYQNVHFERIKRINGSYITNPRNRPTDDARKLFREIQIKRLLRSVCALCVSKNIRKKLYYFSQGETSACIYKLQDAKDLELEEKYAIHYIGHSTVLIQIPGFNILTDPILCSRNALFCPERTISHPGIKHLPKIDVIIISHDHADHTDKRTLQNLLKHHKTKRWLQPKVLVPIGNRRLFERFGFRQVIEVEWYTKISIMQNYSANFVSIPADHRSGRGFSHNKSLVSGWIINPIQENVILKFSGESTPLSEGNQKAVDTIIWNEIKHKESNEGKYDYNIEIPDVICLEASGPNYTRNYQDVMHSSTSYSALLKFTESENLAKLSKQNYMVVLKKFRTYMIHHNKFEFGPDRFNEGLFILKKAVKYLDLDQDHLNKELGKQQKKISQNLDKKALRKNCSCMLRPAIALLPKRTSILIHAKDFIVKDVMNITKKLEEFSCDVFKEFLINNTVFPKIGERLNSTQITNTKFEIEKIQKYYRLQRTSGRSTEETNAFSTFEIEPHNHNSISQLW